MSIRPEAQPPIAPVRPHTVPSPHGERNDDYYWLRDDKREQPEILAYLKAENDYRESVMAGLKPLEDKLFDEIVGRIKPDDASVPYLYRGYWQYARYESGKEYPIYCRRKGSMDAPEEIVVDGNKRAEPHDYYQLAAVAMSLGQRYIALAEDTQGRRQYEIRFVDLTGENTFDEVITGVSGSQTWANDDKTLFYAENDPETLLSVRIKKHILGTDPASDVVVYEEEDPSFYIGVGRSGDDKFVIISSSSTVSSEARFIRADTPEQPFEVFAPRERDHEYDADHIEDRWVVHTNWKAKNFRVMQVADSEVGTKDNWRELVPHNDDILIDTVELFRNYYVLAERSQATRRLRICSWDATHSEYLEVDEEAYTADLSSNATQDTDWLRYSYTSLTTPTSVYETNMKTGERNLLKRQPVLGGYDQTLYETRRLWATARDQTLVPISLVYKKGTPIDGTAPLYQYAYGSYGISSDPEFVSSVVSLLDRGFVYAIAHIRGGEEMGRKWYEDGKLLNKSNTFSDFIDVTEHLIQQGYAHPERVAAMGGSAGGLLMGAIANMRPDLYRLLLSHVPFVDVVTTMLDESIPLTTNEFDEWGNPKNKQYYDYMLGYSPYDNIEKKDYPSILVTAGLWDSQVQYYEPAKWVAKLRANKTDNNPLLFHINMDAGHGGKSGRFRSQRERAMEFAFVLQQLDCSVE